MHVRGRLGSESGTDEPCCITALRKYGEMRISSVLMCMLVSLEEH